MDEQAEIYWDKLSLEDKKKLLSENDFWDGFITSKYYYLPSDLKTIIESKIEKNNP